MSTSYVAESCWFYNHLDIVGSVTLVLVPVDFVEILLSIYDFGHVCITECVREPSRYTLSPSLSTLIILTLIRDVGGEARRTWRRSSTRLKGEALSDPQRGNR